MICLAGQTTSLREAYCMCSTPMLAALGKAILHSGCGPLGPARLRKTPLPLQENHIV